MTAHVFVVSAVTFDLHLKYLFVGTGSKDHQIDFNASSTSDLHYRSEDSLVSMLSDASRLRKGDSVYFYVQQETNTEGKFYGVFECVQDGSFLDNDDETQFLRNDLEKNLNIRARIKPKQLYAFGVSEWVLLDDISSIDKPNEMLWSLIYRKLKGNRGNTMITLFEEKQILNKLAKRNSTNLAIPQGANLEYRDDEIKVNPGTSTFVYSGNAAKIDLLPRLRAKYLEGKAFEAHLQAYMVASILKGSNRSLDSALFENHSLEWLGNEVSCGVGMQRIDILTQTKHSAETIVSPIELKAVSAQGKNLKQIQRYVDWLKLYYLPTMPGKVRPVLVTKDFNVGDEDSKKYLFTQIQEFNLANSDCLPLVWVTFSFEGDELVFKEKAPN
jgi:hypothetical protein